MIKRRFLPLVLAGMIMMSGVTSDVTVFAEQTETVAENTVEENTIEENTATENTTTENTAAESTAAESTATDNSATENTDANVTDVSSETESQPVGTKENPITNAADLYSAFENATGTEDEPQEIYIKSKKLESGYVPILLNETVNIGSDSSAQYIKLIAVDQTIIGRNMDNGESFDGHLFQLNNGSLEFAVTDSGVLKVDGTNASSNQSPSVGSLVSLEGANTKFILNDKVALTNNYTARHGGAIFNYNGTVELKGGIITGNKITTNSTKQAYGGGILSNRKVIVSGNVKVIGNARTTTQGNLITDNISFNASENFKDSAYLEIANPLTGDGRQLGISVCLEPKDYTSSQLVRTENADLDLAANIQGKIKYDFDSKYTEKDGKLSILAEDIQPYGLNTAGVIYKAPMLNNGNASENAEIESPVWLDRSSVVLTGRYYCDAPVTVFALAKEHATGIEDTVSLQELVDSSIKGEINSEEHTYEVNLQDLDANKNYTVFFLAQSEDGALSVTAQFDYSKLNEGRPEQDVQTNAEVLNAEEIQDIYIDLVAPTPTPDPSVTPDPSATPTPPVTTAPELIEGAQFSLIDKDGNVLKDKDDESGKEIKWTSTADDKLESKWKLDHEFLKLDTVYGIREDKLASGLNNTSYARIYFKLVKNTDEETGKELVNLVFTDEAGNENTQPSNVLYDAEKNLLSVVNTNTKTTFERKTFADKDAQTTLAIEPVLDQNGKEIDSKKSGKVTLKASVKVSNLSDGVYKITAKSKTDNDVTYAAKAFYIKAQNGNITFVDKDGKELQANDLKNLNRTVTLKDTTITIKYKYLVKLSKVDESGSTLKDAVFSLKSGSIKAKWNTSEKNPYNLQFEPGEYTVKETTTPKGYTKVADFKLTVGKDGKLSSSSKNVTINGNTVTIKNVKATPAPEPTNTPIPKRPSVKESTLTGLESPKAFYPKVMYPFTVTGAGIDNNDPHEGDYKWYPFYWTTKASDVPDDDFENEKPVQNWKIGNKKGIKKEKTFNLYVWFRRYIYRDGEWERDTRYDDQHRGKQRVVYQFRSSKVDKETFNAALSGTPVPDNMISDGGMNAGDDDMGDGGTSNTNSSSKEKVKSAKTGDDTPIGTMIALIGVAIIIICFILVLKKKKK